MEDKKFNLIKFFKNAGKIAKIIMGIAAMLLVVITILCIIFAPSGETTFSVKTSLKEVLETSNLSTAEYTYNSIAKIPIDTSKELNDDNIKYHVAYKGIVKAGFDFQKIETVEKENSIIVIIPKIEIQNVDVNTDLEYIFIKQKYDTENTYAEAYNACYKDLEAKAKTNKTLITTAIDSAIETVTALTKPLEKGLEEGTTIKIVYVDNYVAEAK